MIPAISSTNGSTPSDLQRSGGVAFTWDVAPFLLDVLLDTDSGGPDALPLERWQEAGVLEVIKTGRHRTVYRLELSGGLSGSSLFIKRYRAAP